MKKILIVIGTRPEAIKMAPLIRSLKNENKLFEIKVCISGQHQSMLTQALDIFNINPDYNLDIMEPNQTLFTVTSKIIKKMEQVLSEFEPHLVLVHGDTTTTFAGAISSFYHKIPVGHIEAGLRTNNIYSPFPEELNRKLTSQIAALHLAPTQKSMDNLIKEGVSAEKIIITGNTVIDALFLTLEKINNNTDVKKNILKDFAKKGYFFPEYKRIILVTGHRRENFGTGFINICKALKELAINNSDVDIVYPVHLNPKVKIPVHKILGKISNIHLIEPLDYESFVYLMNQSHIIITDSGGVQEEAPSLGKPVLVMRENTERPEALKAGTVQLVGTKKELIVSEAQKLLDNEEKYSKMSLATNPYGDGNSSLRIVNFLKKELK
ncbi:UDP-N-acetylglucosamine 2-epimerase (non-hydrolyzing) [Candidatus Marinimicrobia bacterium]|nr:UDP-N-acetylglucosamine 2-epimerase (non-hydrolyzing) [Candidatus Neomarinimicrobiota bacterium]